MACVYILTNKSIPNQVKIGHTSNTAEQRCKEISGATAAPTPFEVAYSAFTVSVEAAHQLEKSVHKTLANVRTNAKREFFAVTVEKARETIERIGNNRDLITHTSVHVAQELAAIKQRQVAAAKALAEQRIAEQAKAAELRAAQQEELARKNAAAWAQAEHEKKVFENKFSIGVFVQGLGCFVLFCIAYESKAVSGWLCLVAIFCGGAVHAQRGFEPERIKDRIQNRNWTMLVLAITLSWSFHALNAAAQRGVQVERIAAEHRAAEERKAAEGRKAVEMLAAEMRAAEMRELTKYLEFEKREKPCVMAAGPQGTYADPNKLFGLERDIALVRQQRALEQQQLTSQVVAQSADPWSRWGATRFAMEFLSTQVSAKNIREFAALPYAEREKLADTFIATIADPNKKQAAQNVKYELVYADALARMRLPRGQEKCSTAPTPVAQVVGNSADDVSTRAHDYLKSQGLQVPTLSPMLGLQKP